MRNSRPKVNKEAKLSVEIKKDKSKIGDDEKERLYSNLADLFSHPAWKNIYLRISIFSFTLLNVDTLVLLSSNYKLYEYLQSESSLTEVFGLSQHHRLGYSLLSPLIWYFLSVITTAVTIFYHHCMAFFEKSNPRNITAQKIRKELGKTNAELLEKIEGLEKSKRIKRVKIENSQEKFNLLSSQSEKLYKITADLFHFSNSISENFTEEFRVSRKAKINNRYTVFDFAKLDVNDLNSSMFLVKTQNKAYDRFYGIEDTDERDYMDDHDDYDPMDEMIQEEMERLLQGNLPYTEPS